MIRRLALFALLFFVPRLDAQNITQPDCMVPFNLTAVGRSNVFQNGAGCTEWYVTYKATGFTAVTVQFEGAGDSSGAPSGFGLWPGTAPITSRNDATLVAFGYRPWASVRLTEVSGSGSVSGVFMGWRRPVTSTVSYLILGGAASPTAVLPSRSTPGLPLPSCNAVRKTNCR